MIIIPNIIAIIPHFTMGEISTLSKKLYKPNPIRTKTPAEKTINPKMLNGFIFYILWQKTLWPCHQGFLLFFLIKIVMLPIAPTKKPIGQTGIAIKKNTTCRTSIKELSTKISFVIMPKA